MTWRPKNEHYVRYSNYAPKRYTGAGVKHNAIVGWPLSSGRDQLFWVEANGGENRFQAGTDLLQLDGGDVFYAGDFAAAEVVDT